MIAHNTQQLSCIVIFSKLPIWRALARVQTGTAAIVEQLRLWHSLLAPPGVRQVPPLLAGLVKEFKK